MLTPSRLGLKLCSTNFPSPSNPFTTCELKITLSGSVIPKWFVKTSPTFVSLPAYGQSLVPAQQSLAQSFVFTRHWSTSTWLALQVLSCEVPASSRLGWFRAFAPGLSSVERHRLEPRPTQEFLQVLYHSFTCYCMSLLSYAAF